MPADSARCVHPAAVSRPGLGSRPTHKQVLAGANFATCVNREGSPRLSLAGNREHLIRAYLDIAKRITR